MRAGNFLALLLGVVLGIVITQGSHDRQTLKDYQNLVSGWNSCETRLGVLEKAHYELLKKTRR